MEHFTLWNGIRMPALGFGTWTLRGQEGREAIRTALEVGYRLLDTARMYENEEAVGQAVKDSGLPRQEVFLTTKLWIQDAGYEPARTAFETSLKKLGLEYLDLYLIHQPMGDYYGSWRAMEELYAAGKVRAIGVSNCQPRHLD